MSVYDVISARVISLLEAGVAPWRKPWGGARLWPRNLVSGHKYRGINVFLLACSGYSSPFWLTYKQAQAMGGHVRKGEKASPIVFWTKIEKSDRDTGEQIELPILRYYSGFNVAQCEGLPEKRIPSLGPVAERPFSPIEVCEHVVNSMPNRPEIRHGFEQASYIPKLDEVRMPFREQFDSPEGYYTTAFHELTHSTGHASRLNRKGIADEVSFASDTYSREELIAEMGAAFLSGHCGIENATIDNSASYLAGWLRVLRQDSRLVVTAAAQAQKAVDFVLNKTWGDESADMSGE